jgi:hypothetical protein
LQPSGCFAILQPLKQTTTEANNTLELETMHKNIGYHTRLSSNNTVKVVGGSFGGQVDQETIERLVNNLFNVIIKPSGRAVFVDRDGREVSLYVTIDPKNTSKGKKALQEERARKEALAEKDSEMASIVEDLLSSMSYEEILKRLE